MGEAKHTKGPWFAEKPRQHWRVWCEDGSRTGSIVAMVNSIFGHTENEANARLIAAAPDLLEVLEEALPFIGYGQHVPDIISKVEAAIAKAKGLSPSPSVK